MRKEKGMNKSCTRLHLLLENSKQKQALSTRTKGNVLQGCSLSILLFSLQSRGKRGSEICHLPHTAPFSVAGAQSRMFLPRWPRSLGLCDRGDPQPQARESFKGGQQYLTYHLQGFKAAPVCFSTCLAKFRNLWGALPSSTGMQECFMSHPSSPPFSAGGLTPQHLEYTLCKSHSLQRQWQVKPHATKSSWAFPVAHPTCRTQFGRMRVERWTEGKTSPGSGDLLSARQ